MSVPVICLSCSETASVNRVTAGLRHSCGGAVDLYLGTPEQEATIARRHASTFADWMGFTATSGEEDNGSNEYAGKMPGPNEMSNHEGEITCPACGGSGKDIQDKTDPCRECGGDGHVTPTTTPEAPMVYRHQYPSNQTKVPFMGRRKSASVGRREAMLRTVLSTNDVSPREAERLVDAAMRKYPEVR